MSDVISRQVAISAICSACGKIDCDKMDKCEKLQLPPANCSEFPNSSDTISRSKAIDTLRGYLVGKRCPDDGTLTCRLIENEVINKLPPAQPEQLSTNLASLGTDCISRQAAIDRLTEYGNGRAVFISVGEAVIRIEQLPPAQPEPLQPWEVLAAQAVLSQPKLGKWIYHIDDLFPAESTMECNQCHAEQPLTCDDEFCPHCGAEMEVTE